MNVSQNHQFPMDIRERTKDVKELLNLLKPKGQELKRKVNLYNQILQDDLKTMQDVVNSLSEVDDQTMTDEIAIQKQLLMNSDRELEHAEMKVSELEHQTRNAELRLENFRQQQQEDKIKKYPRARYIVNLFREICKISWHPEQQPHEVKGFIRGKSTIKTFCFDEHKQSEYFITNSLWEMGEEESW